MPIPTTISPDGERLVTMTAEEYQDLIDARDAAVAMRDIAAGTMPTVAEADLDAYLAAPTPLAFWRKHRGLTQIEVSQAADISQPYLAQLENGQREGAVSVYARLAKVLHVRIDDLVAGALAARTARGDLMRTHSRSVVGHRRRTLVPRIVDPAGFRSRLTGPCRARQANRESTAKSVTRGGGIKRPGAAPAPAARIVSRAARWRFAGSDAGGRCWHPHPASAPAGGCKRVSNAKTSCTIAP